MSKIAALSVSLSDRKKLASPKPDLWRRIIILTHKKKSAEDWIYLGSRQLQKGNWKKAIDRFSKALALEQNNVHAYMGRAKANYYAGNSAAAISDCEKVFDNRTKHHLEGPVYAETYCIHGMACNILNKPAIASESFKVALGYTPAYPEALEGLAYARRTTGDMECFQHLANAAAQYLKRGVEKHGKGDFKGAVLDLTALLSNGELKAKLNDDQIAEALVTCGDAYSDIGKRKYLKVALQYYRLTLEQGRMNGAHNINGNHKLDDYDLRALEGCISAHHQLYQNGEALVDARKLDELKSLKPSEAATKLIEWIKAGSL